MSDHFDTLTRALGASLIASSAYQNRPTKNQFFQYKKRRKINEASFPSHPFKV